MRIDRIGSDFNFCPAYFCDILNNMRGNVLIYALICVMSVATSAIGQTESAPKKNIREFNRFLRRNDLSPVYNNHPKHQSYMALFGKQDADVQMTPAPAAMPANFDASIPPPAPAGSAPTPLGGNSPCMGADKIVGYDDFGDICDDGTIYYYVDNGQKVEVQEGDFTFDEGNGAMTPAPAAMPDLPATGGNSPCAGGDKVVGYDDFGDICDDGTIYYYLENGEKVEVAEGDFTLD